MRLGAWSGDSTIHLFQIVFIISLGNLPPVFFKVVVVSLVFEVPDDVPNGTLMSCMIPVVQPHSDSLADLKLRLGNRGTHGVVKVTDEPASRQVDR